MALVIERRSLMVYGHGWEYATLKRSPICSIRYNCQVGAIAARFLFHGKHRRFPLAVVLIKLKDLTVSIVTRLDFVSFVQIEDCEQSLTYSRITP
jgi:hypothetical protein